MMESERRLKGRRFRFSRHCEEAERPTKQSRAAPTMFHAAEVCTQRRRAAEKVHTETRRHGDTEKKAREDTKMESERRPLGAPFFFYSNTSI